MIIKTTKSPKQIIVDHKGQAAPWPYPYDFSVRYVRADLVDGLVQALEGLLAYSGIIEERDSNCATNKARAALKALEE